jgi:hypothetical protein
LKFTATFLLVIVVVFSGLTRSAMGDDHEVISSDAGANFVVFGEALDSDNDDGTIITSPTLFQPCRFYHPCFAIVLVQQLTAGRNSSKHNLQVYQLNRALLI